MIAQQLKTIYTGFLPVNEYYSFNFEAIDFNSRLHFQGIFLYASVALIVIPRTIIVVH